MLLLCALTTALAGVGACIAAPPPAADPYRLDIAPAEYRLRLPGPAAAKAPRSGRAAGYAPLVERHARARGLDPELVHAVIDAESAYRHEAVSPKGAVGLMQVMPATGRRFGIRNLKNPEDNLAAGTAYLSWLLGRFGRLNLALAAYNAGEGAVARHGNAIPPYPETRAYVAEVLRGYGGSAAPERAGRDYLDGTRLEGLDFSLYRLRRTAARPH